MKEKKLIVFTVDKNYLIHLAVALSSFFDFHDPKNFELGLLYSDVSEESLDKFLYFCSANQLSVKAHRIEDKFDSIPVGYHFNEVIFYRLLAPELFAGHDRILYIDSDILFLESIAKIFEIDLGPCVLGAVEKTSFTGVPAYLRKYIDRYFASGLLLIDTKKFINKSIMANCIKFLNESYYEMPDQDALSFVVQDFVPIDPSYSVETAFLNQDAPEYGFAKNPKIIQFSGSSKPWHMNNNHPYKKLYWHYRNQTPYKSLFPDDFSLLNVARYIAPNFVKSVGKKIIGKNP